MLQDLDYRITYTHKLFTRIAVRNERTNAPRVTLFIGYKELTLSIADEMSPYTKVKGIRHFSYSDPDFFDGVIKAVRDTVG